MNILLIQILRLGDALQLTPIIAGLKKVFPDSRISVLTSSLGARIFGAQPEIDQVFELRKEKLLPLVQSSRLEDILEAVDMLEADLEPFVNQKWDWVINFSYSFPSAILAYIADGTHCSGFHATSKRQYFSKEKWFAYCISAFLNRKYSVFNWVDINKHIINLPYIPPHTNFPIKDDELRHAEAHLVDMGFGGQKIIGLHPGASSDFKKWPLEKFVTLGRNLTERHHHKIIVFGVEREAELGHRLQEAIGSGCADMTGKTSLPALAAYLSKCHLLVSNDTGPAHVASAVGTPVLGLFFSTHFMETGPYGPGHLVVYPDISCFPCQGTAKCPHKECLTYVKPETIERIIVSHGALREIEGPIVLAEDDGPVAVSRSVFDLWGNLEWRPFEKRKLKSDDVLRLIYKVFWLSALKDDDQMEQTLPEYVSDFVSTFDGIDQAEKCKALLAEFGEALKQIERLYGQGHELSLKLYDALLSGDTPGVRELGEGLQKKEDEISAGGENAHLNALTEYVAIRRDNIDESDLAKLALRTASLYREAQHLASGLNKYSEKIMNMVLSNTPSQPI